MSAEIVALRCPSCGSATSVPGRQLHFGCQFKCGHCSTVSVLIVNRQLYLAQPGDVICCDCGRVARNGARYCQCGKPLLRQCDECKRESPVHHTICDYCGLPTIALETREDENAAVTQALKVLGNPSVDYRVPVRMLSRLGLKASAAIPALAALYRRRLNNHYDKNSYEIIRALAEIGAPIAEITRMIDDFEKRFSDERWHLTPYLFSSLITCVKREPLSAGDAIRIIKLHAATGIEEQTDEARRGACDALLAMGPPGYPGLVELVKNYNFSGPALDCIRESKDRAFIPLLQPLTGWFSGERKDVKGKANHLIKMLRWG